MLVSVALIVKDETTSLERCLRSVREAVDEVVVVTTSAHEETRAIARRYADEVHHFTWRQDFAAARQFAFDHAHGDWVFWLDADDVVHGAEHIRPHVAAAPADLAVFYWRYIYGHDAYGRVTAEAWRERCVRNDGTFHWEGRVHEALVAARDVRGMRDEAIYVVHHPEPGRADTHSRRNLDILLEQYAHQADPSPRLLLYLGNEYADTGQMDEAVRYWRRYVELSGWDEEKYVTQLRIAAQERAWGHVDDALNAALMALKTLPHWPHAYFSLAETYYFEQDWPKVVHWIEIGKSLPIPQATYPNNPLDVTYRWIIHYTNALYQVGRLRDALDWTERALAMSPDEEWHLKNRTFFRQALGMSSSGA